MLATPTTATLSVMRTFISVPSRDFTVSKEPSMASMVPRIRTVGGCCAHPTDPSTNMSASDAMSARGINQDIFSITFLPESFCEYYENTAGRGLFRCEIVQCQQQTLPLQRSRSSTAAAS